MDIIQKYTLYQCICTKHSDAINSNENQKLHIVHNERWQHKLYLVPRAQLGLNHGRKVLQDQNYFTAGAVFSITGSPK